MTFYEKRKAAGLCVTCGAPVTKGVNCDKCKAKIKALKRLEYDELKNRKACVKCGKPAEKGKVHCSVCLQMLRVKQKQRYRELTEEQRMKKRVSHKLWLEKNPDKKALYLERQRERNRRYDNV